MKHLLAAVRRKIDKRLGRKRSEQQSAEVISSLEGTFLTTLRTCRSSLSSSLPPPSSTSTPPSFRILPLNTLHTQHVDPYEYKIYENIYDHLCKYDSSSDEASSKDSDCYHNSEDEENIFGDMLFLTSLEVNQEDAAADLYEIVVYKDHSDETRLRFRPRILKSGACNRYVYC